MVVERHFFVFFVTPRVPQRRNPCKPALGGRGGISDWVERAHRLRAPVGSHLGCQAAKLSEAQTTSGDAITVGGRPVPGPVVILQDAGGPGPGHLRTEQRTSQEGKSTAHMTRPAPGRRRCRYRENAAPRAPYSRHMRARRTAPRQAGQTNYSTPGARRSLLAVPSELSPQTSNARGP